jgi:hypothetical protein
MKKAGVLLLIILMYLLINYFNISTPNIVGIYINTNDLIDTLIINKDSSFQHSVLINNKKVICKGKWYYTKGHVWLYPNNLARKYYKPYYCGGIPLKYSIVGNVRGISYDIDDYNYYKKQ